jgi:hypothetical protein
LRNVGAAGKRPSSPGGSVGDRFPRSSKKQLLLATVDQC